MSEELFIHQYKFADWMPSSIHSITVDKYSGIVAVGRQDGEIELISPDYNWNTQVRISGKSDFELSGLVFSEIKTESGRLFGSTMQGYLFEIDFVSLTTTNIRDSFGGTVWSLTASKLDSILGVGCEDGTIKLFSYANSQLEYMKSMSATGSRVLSVAFHPTEPRVYGGCADGTIRCYNMSNGMNIFRIVGDGNKNSRNSIWSLLVLKDSTLISGDNRGRVQFWNGYSGNELLSTIQQHTSTILCLTTNDKEDTIFASGEDSRVICLRRLNISRDNSNLNIYPSYDITKQSTFDNMINCQWIYTNSHRPHSHDVRSLVIATQHSDISGPKSILISGGIDSKLCLYSVDDFTGCRPTWILPIPARGITSATSDSKYLALKHRTHIDIWTLRHPNLSNTRKMEEINQTIPFIDKIINGCSLSCRIQLKSNISRDFFHSIALSNNGKLLAATGGGAHESDSLDALSGFRLWLLKESSTSSSSSSLSSSIGEITAEKISLPSDLLDILTDGMCQSVAFNNDGSSLCVVVTGLNSVKLLLLDIQHHHHQQQQQQQEEKQKQQQKNKKNKSHNLHINNNDNDDANNDDNDDNNNESNITISLRDIINHSRNLKKNKQSDNSNTIINLHENLSFSISSVSYSADGRWLAVCSSDKRVFIYEIDRLMLHWELPTFDSPVSCLAFHPQSPNIIIIVLSGDNSFHIFDVQDKTLTPWSLQNKDLLPTWIENLENSSIGSVVNVSFDPTCLNAFVLHGQAFSVYINLDHPISQLSNNTTTKSNLINNNNNNNNNNHSSQQNFIPSLVTNELLSKSETKIEQLEREINSLPPICRRNIKKRKKLEQLLEVERRLYDEKEAEELSKNDEEQIEKTPMKKKLKKQLQQSNINGKDHINNNNNNPILMNTNRNFSVLKTHRSIVHLSLLNSHEMVVVENPWVRILENLPDTLARKRYGT